MASPTRAAAAAQVPVTSSKASDGTFAANAATQRANAAARVHARQAELRAMLDAGPAGGGAPSFYERDVQRLAERRKRIETHRRNKNRFQVGAFCRR